MKHLIPTDPNSAPRDPATGKPVPAAGVKMHEVNKYWRRRLADGSMKEAGPVKAPRAPKAHEAKDLE